MGFAEDMWLSRILHPQSRKIYSRVVGRRPLPKRLYHYTTPDGLLGILESSSLWATEARYLNDVSEIKYAEQLIREEIVNQVEGVDNDLRAWLGEFVNVLGRVGADTESYVAAFCESGDLLGQWRAYGKDGGFALGFSGIGLASLPNCHVVRVEYHEATQRETITKLCVFTLTL